MLHTKAVHEYLHYPARCTPEGILYLAACVCTSVAPCVVTWSVEAHNYGLSHKLHVPGRSWIQRGFPAWDTLQDSTDNSNIEKVEPSLERQFSQFQDTTDALPCDIHFLVRLWIHGPSQQSCKEEYEACKWGAMLFVQRPCYQRESLSQDPAGNRTTRWLPDYRKETQTEVVWTCLPFIWSGQNHLARRSERGKKTRQTKKKKGGKTTSGNGQAWCSPNLKGQWKTAKNGGNWLWSDL